MVRALDEAQRTGPVKWCWLELADKRGVEVFLRFAARKAEWLTEHPARHRAPRLGPKRNSKPPGGEQGSDSLGNGCKVRPWSGCVLGCPHYTWRALDPAVARVG